MSQHTPFQLLKLGGFTFWQESATVFWGETINFWTIYRKPSCQNRPGRPEPICGWSIQSVQTISYDENTLATPYPSHSVGKRSKFFPIIMLKIDLNNWFIYRSMMYHFVSLRMLFFSELGSRCAWVSGYARQTLCSDLSAAQNTRTSLELNNLTHLEKLLVLQLTPS